MAKKKAVEDQIVEEEVFDETQDIELYEINERYGITPEGVVYDIERETALVPILDDIGRPCVKIGKKRYPIETLKKKYLPQEDKIEVKEDKQSNIKSKPTQIKVNGEVFNSYEEASRKLGINANVIRNYILKGGK